MRNIDWQAHASHRRQVAEDTGQWFGLLDENWVPFLDLPQITALDWPGTRGAIESVSLTLRVRTPSGRMHAVVKELVADNLGRVDMIGRLIPVTGPARLVAMQRPDRRRRTMLVTHVVAEGDTTAPHTLTIHGVDLLGYLDLLPCPSNPLSWTGEFTRFTRDWVGPENEDNLFDRPRDLAPATMITVADGASVDGDSDEVIYRLIQESLDAVHRVRGITTDPYYVVALAPRRARADRMILRPTDQTIWKEIADAALTYGVSVRADLWWPGDDQPEGHALELPTIVFTVRQEA